MLSFIPSMMLNGSPQHISPYDVNICIIFPHMYISFYQCINYHSSCVLIKFVSGFYPLLLTFVCPARYYYLIKDYYSKSLFMGQNHHFIMYCILSTLCNKVIQQQTCEVILLFLACYSFFCFLIIFFLWQ